MNYCNCLTLGLMKNFPSLDESQLDSLSSEPVDKRRIVPDDGFLGILETIKPLGSSNWSAILVKRNEEFFSFK